MTIGRIDINEKDLPKICGAVIQLEEQSETFATTAYVTAAIAAIPATSSTPQSGRLNYVSATALAFKPYNGDSIKINGVAHTIPSAGIAGVANTSVFVNGTGGQNLAASTVYYVYAFMNSTTVTADFSTTTHATSTTTGNIGVEIKSGDDTRTLIGMVRTNASSQFQSDEANRFVISWFNRRNISMLGAVSAASTASTTLVEIGGGAYRVNFVSWGEEGISAAVAGYNTNSSAVYNIVYIGIDGVANTALVGAAAAPGGGYAQVVIPWNTTSTDGFHYFLPYGAVSAGNGTFYLYITAMIRG